MGGKFKLFWGRGSNHVRGRSRGDSCPIETGRKIGKKKKPPEKKKVTRRVKAMNEIKVVPYQKSHNGSKKETEGERVELTGGRHRTEKG